MLLCSLEHYSCKQIRHINTTITEHQLSEDSAVIAILLSHHLPSLMWIPVVFVQQPCCLLARNEI